MATIVTQSHEQAPWWAPLAVSVLGEVWDKWQQREANKKANAYESELSKIMSPQTPEVPVTPLGSTGQGGLLNTPVPDGYNNNGWAKSFHNNYTPLTQFDLGTSGIAPNAAPVPTATPQVTGLGGLPNVLASGGNGNAWSNLLGTLGNSNSPLAQFDAGTSGIVPAAAAQSGTPTSPAPLVTGLGSNQGIPKPIDFYRAAMALKGSKRFAGMGAADAQRIIDPYMKLLEANRQEELRNALAQDFTNATDRTGRLNTIAGGMITGALGRDIGNDILKANGLTQNNIDLGGNIVPSTTDQWTGQTTYGDSLAKSMTPSEVARNQLDWAIRNDNVAHNAAVLRENARQFDVNDAFRRQPNYQLINGGDGQYHSYNPRTGQHDPTGIPAPTNQAGQTVTIPKDVEARLKLNEQERKSKQDQITAIDKRLNALRDRDETDTPEYKALEADKTRLQKEITDSYTADRQTIDSIRQTGQGQPTPNNDISQVSEGMDIGKNMLGTKKATITTPYGTPRKKADGTSYNHNAVDYAMTKDTPIRLDDVGVPMTVTKVANQPSGYGNYVDLEGTLTGSDGKQHKIGMRFAHMGDGTVNVKQGQTVRVGDLIGKVGNTGNSRGKNGGYHLHLETTIDGKPVDPTKFKSLIAPYMAYSKTVPSGTFSGVTPSPKVTVMGNTSEEVAYRNPTTGETITNDEVESMKSDGKTERDILANGFQPVQSTSSDVPVSTQKSTLPTSSDLEVTPRTINNDITPDMAAIMPKPDPLDYSPSYMRTNLPAARSFTRQSGEIPHINPSSHIAYRPSTPTFTARSPEMPQASMQETANTQQGLDNLNNGSANNNPIAFIDFSKDYPYLESEDVWPQYNDPINDPDYSPIPNIDQPELPPIFRAFSRFNRSPFGTQLNTWRI